MSVVPHTDEFHYWKLRKWSSKYLTILGNCRQCDSNDLYWYGFVEILIYQWILRIMCTLTWILVSWSLNKQITVARDCITRKTFGKSTDSRPKILFTLRFTLFHFLHPILFFISSLLVPHICVNESASLPVQIMVCRLFGAKLLS